MGDNRDLEELAKSSTDDFYELLGVAFDAEAAAIQKAYRKASIKYHPDKNPDDKTAADRFIALGWARDILIDEKLKGEYDRARTRRREKALQNERLDERRRKMKEDLERREQESKDSRADLKRKMPEDMNEAEQQMQRLAEDGRRRREALQERWAKERQEEEERWAKKRQEAEEANVRPKTGDSSETDRAVIVRFQREGDSLHWDKEKLASMFAKYGKVDMVLMLKEKKIRLSGEKHRKVLAVASIVYTRIDHAHAAVMDAKSDFPALESVRWAGREPNLKPSDTPTGPSKSTSTSEDKSSQKPWFSLEEEAMMKLKEAARMQAEKKKLEEQLRKQEAEAAKPPEASVQTPLRPFRSVDGTPLVTPKFSSFSPKASKKESRESQRKRLEEEIRQQEAAEEAAEKAAAEAAK
ncbi:hypothetical protein yc1106_09347 [Curvularia clavata]|uniref:J domain-containing protein n=1 Tax=Curvularia clavata TaxID=95742 RepID=A0A9Q9DVE6_CURCL|nr:hypothetical protein yc1106_09347 [Curvularia clavata]